MEKERECQFNYAQYKRPISTYTYKIWIIQKYNLALVGWEDTEYIPKDINYTNLSRYVSHRLKAPHFVNEKTRVVEVITTTITTLVDL